MMRMIMGVGKMTTKKTVILKIIEAALGRFFIYIYL